ncbi:hypothetical protein [Nitrosomonas sp. Nm166]|uniref:hypothetical protein n=1 Tax=Nitrosomonas sp. Nm166 TaxID=1881054 RepID=UPI0008E9211B|nr:hypothetical protein [Nitrosomonas sp. Nm166]SFE15670.1 hypothetical protein SAMN05428977_100816 [Nitrosomonas sp. Nm166]
MGAILKGFILFLFVFALTSQAGLASATQSDDLLFLSSEKASIDELEKARGREGFDITTINNMNVQATLTGNTANNNATGMNLIDNGAFTNASGMFSVIQNTGNNVIIQDSTIVNVTIVP